MIWPCANWLWSVTVRSNWAACWSELRTPLTTDSFGIPRLPMMSAGGSPLLMMPWNFVVAGARWIVTPSARTTLRVEKVGFDSLLIAAETTPPRRRKTASPRTISAGPRTDIGS